MSEEAEATDTLAADLSQNLSWPDAIEQVLLDTGEAMHYADVAEAVYASNYRSHQTATPANTVASQISLDRKKGDASRFLRVGKGFVALREERRRLLTAGTAPTNDDSVDDADDETSAGVIQALGMFWNRAMVDWRGGPKLLGQQNAGASTVDFTQQDGVYLLHDRREVIYVGQASNQSLGVRLKSHTRNRLAGRWDRFSWFGLRQVEDNGSLGETTVAADASHVITAFEAILIEALEPRQNRRGGDYFSAVEFLQVEDPALEETRRRTLVQQFASQVGVNL